MKALKNIIFWVLTIVVAVGAIGLLTLQVKGIDLIAVEGDSMAPEITNGSVVGVAEVKSDELKVGDDIVFISGDALAIRRIESVDHTEDTVLVHTYKVADGQNVANEIVKYEDVVGSVKFNVQGMALFTTLAGKTLVLCVVFGLYVLTFFLDKWSKRYA